MTSYIIFAFVSGFSLATVIFWITTKQLQKDWQAEYRRLMSGIKIAYEAVDQGNVVLGLKKLSDIYYDRLELWPRG